MPSSVARPSSSQESASNSSSDIKQSDAPVTNQEGAKAFTSARAAFAGYQTKATDESWAEWTKTRRTAATLIGRLSRQQRDTSLVADARQLVRDVSASGVFGAGIAPEDE